jgi:tRNA threonylcarbamoyl adenosine modification protein YeaZ
VAVTCGPGNFTGLRIGLAVARTFARIRSLCAYAVSTSGCIALAHGKQNGGRDGNVLVALDTKRGDYYTQLYSSGNDALEAPIIRDAAAIYEVLQNSSDTELIGHGLSSVIAGAPDDLAGQIAGAGYDRRPDPVTIASICFAGDIRAGGADDLRPLYMREAETNSAKQTK